MMAAKSKCQRVMPIILPPVMTAGLLVMRLLLPMKSWIQAKILGLGKPLASHFLVDRLFKKLMQYNFVAHENCKTKVTNNEKLHGNSHA